MQVKSTEFSMSQKEVAKELGIGRGHVNLIEKQALEKVRQELERRGIDAKLFFKD